MIEKAELRARITAARRAMPPAERLLAQRRVCTHILAVCQQRGWRQVAAYVPFASEPICIELLTLLSRNKVAVIVPVVLADNDLDWLLWSPPEPDTCSTDEQVAGTTDAPHLGVAAISAVDAVLVPALAIGDDGTRLGRGGGCYDRALARVAPDTCVAALVYDCEVLPSVPISPWDRPVSAVVTPSGWRELPPAETQGHG